MKKKIRISSELIYLAGVFILSFATAILAAADLGLSMVVVPAYVVSLKVPFLTFGQAEYVVQGTLFIVFCIIMRKAKPLYLVSFLSGFIYGIVLDFWRMVIPYFNPELYPPEMFDTHVKIIYFVIGFFINSFGAMLYFKSYFYPQVYEFFVKGISEKFRIELSKVKRGFDMTFLTIGAILSFVLLGRIAGIGIGTVIMALLNGLLIGFYSKVFDKYIETYPVWKTFSKKFEL